MTGGVLALSQPLKKLLVGPAEQDSRPLLPALELFAGHPV